MFSFTIQGSPMDINEMIALKVLFGFLIFYFIYYGVKNRIKQSNKTSDEIIDFMRIITNDLIFERKKNRRLYRFNNRLKRVILNGKGIRRTILKNNIDF